MNADEYIKALAKPGVSREIEDDGDINDDIPTRNNTSPIAVEPLKDTGEGNNATKDLNTEEIDDDDDEDMDGSINQDNDCNDDDDEDYLENTENDQNDSASNPNSSKGVNGILMGSAIGGQFSSSISSKNSRRKNKRKNFKPRNILYGGTDEEEQEQQTVNDASKNDISDNGQDQGPLNLSSHNGNAGNTRTLLPRKILEQQLLAQQRGELDPGSASSPMDLSNYQQSETNEDYNSNTEEVEENALVLDEKDSEEDGEGDNKTAASAAAKGLSVVRPEVLFGDNNSNSVTSGSPTSSPGLPIPPTSQSLPFGAAGMFPPGLMPLLGMHGATTRSSSSSTSGLPSADAMKEAFQEVLKLYGVPSELAEAIAKNAQNTQGKDKNSFSYILKIIRL